MFEDHTIKKISKESHVTDLWAGYGSIHRVKVYFDNGTALPLIIKRVNPPCDEGSTQSVSHVRKLKSYQIEGNFYSDLAPILESSNLKCHVPIPYSIIESPSSNSFQFVLSDLSSNFSSTYGSLNESQTYCALSWLAKLHATFYQHTIITSTQNKEGNDNEVSLVWDYGGYWHLKTRLEELESIDSSKHRRFSCFHPKRSQLAFLVDERMNASRHKSHTLVHGDFKKDNIMFSDTVEDECAAVDFQYCGAGYGMKDVVMLIVSSVSSRVLSTVGEEGLIMYYYQEFMKYYKNVHTEIDHSTLEEEITPTTMKKQYELSLLDYVRFMDGWGFWGSNASYAEERAWATLKELVSLVKDVNMNTIDPAFLHSMTSDDWTNAIYQKFPLHEF